MASKTEIANLAIANLGEGKRIANLDTENSAEANACRLYYEASRKLVLRDFNWPFCTSFATLGLVEERPNDEWAYSYRYPSDCIKLRRILSGLRTDNRQSQVPYKIARDSQGLLIYTDRQNAQIEYTIETTDPGFFSEDFIIALSFKLASYIAPDIGAGDAAQLTERMQVRYKIEIENSRNNALNEQIEDEEPESEFIRAREGYDNYRKGYRGDID